MKESLGLEKSYISMEEHKVMFLQSTPYFGLNLDPCRGRKVLNSVQSKQRILTCMINKEHSQGPTCGNHGLLLGIEMLYKLQSFVEDQDLHLKSVACEKSNARTKKFGDISFDCAFA
jgi:hypothetical protein